MIVSFVQHFVFSVCVCIQMCVILHKITFFIVICFIISQSSSIALLTKLHSTILNNNTIPLDKKPPAT